ncbi:J domain-containing protein [Croceicoccus sediminis]|uniref:J domain-containing protein n=1 Tax=Croceicoccus sediminis TaxID=2571150 RepID=UPI001F0DC42A|nr:DnaJ domain-containing protein [Croceicoccus sediminis]
MMKFVILVLVAGIAFRMLFGTWPWQMFAESEKSQRRAQARTLLGVSRDASAEDILSAHRRAIKNAHPDRGGSSDAVHALDDARDLLLEQSRRKNEL